MRETLGLILMICKVRRYGVFACGIVWSRNWETMSDKQPVKNLIIGSYRRFAPVGLKQLTTSATRANDSAQCGKQRCSIVFNQPKSQLSQESRSAEKASLEPWVFCKIHKGFKGDAEELNYYRMAICRHGAACSGLESGKLPTFDVDSQIH